MTDADNLVTEDDYSQYTVYELKDELKEIQEKYTDDRK